MGYFDDYLEHHGILGQKWGRRNGPPYPIEEGGHSKEEKTSATKAGIKVGESSTTKNKRTIPTVEDYKNMDEEEKKKTKKEVLLSADNKIIKEYSKELTNQEIREAVDRINLMERLDKYDVAPTTFKKIDNTMDKISKIGKWAVVGAGAYNVSAAINNAINPYFNMPGINIKKFKN